MRAIAVIGPSQSGKTTLVERLATQEGRSDQQLHLFGGVSITTFSFMNDRWCAIDIPGGHDAFSLVGPALASCDAAVLCVSAQADAAVLAAPYLRMIEASGLPTLIFINKIEAATDRVAEVVASLQAYCRHGIALRQVPIRQGGEVTGAIDLISERAWEYREGRQSSLVELPPAMKARENEARSELLEALADYSDPLLEEIIEDKRPATEDVYATATQVLQRHDLASAFLGSAGHGNGVHRLMKSLRHEVPGVEALAERDDLPDGVIAVGCFADQQKHLGKVVLVRALGDGVAQGARLGGAGIGNLNSLDGKTPLGMPLSIGEFALAIKSDHLRPASYIASDRLVSIPGWAAAHPPALKRRLVPTHDKDDGKLSAALVRLSEIDTGLDVSQDETSGAMVLGLQGQQHLKSVVEKLSATFGVDVHIDEVPTPLRETIRQVATVHHRHRKQSGGAGQFADVVITLSPRASGNGFAFEETVKGGAVPRNYIPSVEAGARDALKTGPSGCPVIDVGVTLTDGKSHSVDSSDFAFRTAGQSAVKEALAAAGAYLLQPVLNFGIHVPSVFTGSLVQLVSGLKGQVLGFEAHANFDGWDVFHAHLPSTAQEEFARALGSATRGTAWFSNSFDHYEELREPLPADQLLRP